MGNRFIRAAVLGVATAALASSARAQSTTAAPAEPTRGAEASALRAPVSTAGSPRLQPDRPVGGPREAAVRTPRAAQPGLVLSVGVGTSYVALGAQAAYVIPFGSRQFGLVGGIGVAPGVDEASAKVGATAGVQAGFGLNSRLLVEVGVSPAVRMWKLHSVVFAYELIYGPYAQLSYEYQWEMGLLVRVGGGLHAPLTNNFTWLPALSTGVGWKF